ncbi:MAG TPA: hypothetical protein VKB89_33025 [Xanthobacteraceae bacterium]|nr:hypothetical protein [Xanthobacteraceae bacterium]
MSRGPGPRTGAPPPEGVDVGYPLDVFVEYAKEGPEDVLVRITVHNRGPEAARLRVLPTLWFRNTWSWSEGQPKPSLREAGPGAIQATHHELGEDWLLCDDAGELLFEILI